MATDLNEIRNQNVPAAENRLPPRVQEEQTSAEVVAGGSIGEAVGGIAAIVLAIIGLAGLFPSALAAISAIILGAALLLQGASVAARFARLVNEAAGTAVAETELGGGLGAEFLGGAAGIVLGILGLLNIYPMVLLPVAAIVFGGALLLGCGMTARLNALTVERPLFREREVSRRVTADVVAAANGAQALVALAAIILGIIGLVNVYAITLALVAFLCVGAAIVLSGGALSGKMVSMLRR